MTKLKKPLCALAVAAFLVTGAMPASADSFSIFGGSHRDREDREYRYRDRVVVGAPVMVEPAPAVEVVTPGTTTYTTYTEYDPYYDQNYVFDDREGYRYYHNRDGHVLGRVLINAIGRPHSR